MSSFETLYPLEIVHMDFLMIRSKKDLNKDINVLVITDHFTRYMQAFVTTSQTAIVVAQTLYKEYFVHYGWPGKSHSDQAGNFESKVIAELCKKYRKYIPHPITRKVMLNVRSSIRHY